MRNFLSIAATAVAMVVLDLLWLGLVASSLYASQLGDLKRPEAYLPAAGIFYVFYVAATWLYAVRGAATPKDAAMRGAGLGLVAYATYELTNWAVIRDWPALLVPIDIGWGIALTTITAVVGKLVRR